MLDVAVYGVPRFPLLTGVGPANAAFDINRAGFCQWWYPLNGKAKPLQWKRAIELERGRGCGVFTVRKHHRESVLKNRIPVAILASPYGNCRILTGSSARLVQCLKKYRVGVHWIARDLQT